MTPKSYITLCIIGILYVVMAAVAVLSPHGSSYAMGNDMQGSGSVADATPTAQDGENELAVVFRNEEGIEIEFPQSGMNTFAANSITVEIDGKQETFTAASFNSVLTLSGLPTDTDMVVVKDRNGSIVTYRTVDLTKENNAYLIYGDGDGKLLDETKYGAFCLYLVDGMHSGILLDVAVVDFG